MCSIHPIDHWRYWFSFLPLAKKSLDVKGKSVHHLLRRKRQTPGRRLAYQVKVFA
jgi:hypothetical protein